MPNGPWTVYSGGFQNGMTLAITPKNVVLRDNSLKPLLQCTNYKVSQKKCELLLVIVAVILNFFWDTLYIILKIFKIETFWSTLMAKFMILGVIGMCFINFMQKEKIWGVMDFD